MRTAPCKGCTDRHETCHCICEKYQDYLFDKKQINDKIAKEKMIDYTLSELEGNRLGRMRMSQPSGLQRKNLRPRSK